MRKQSVIFTTLLCLGFSAEARQALTTEQQLGERLLTLLIKYSI
ncbi:MAG: hypothetical protein ACXW1W_18985 [Methylococcaceae bacterium]